MYSFSPQCWFDQISVLLEASKMCSCGERGQRFREWVTSQECS